MFKKINSNFPKFYQVSLALVTVTASSALIYFWFSGYLDGSFASSVYQNAQVVENLKNSKMLDYVADSVAKGEIDRALKNLEYFESNVEQIDNFANTNSYEDMEKGLIKLKDSLGKIQSVNSADDALRVFQEKIRSFENYANLNEWRTLSRLSSRIMAKITAQSSMRNNMAEVINSVKTDITIMKKVTMSSVLHPTTKNEIVSRLDSLTHELNMLNGYSSNKSSFQSLLVSYQRSFDRWLTDVSPELALKKLEADRFGHYFLFSLMAIIGLCLSLLAVGSRMHRKFASEEVEALENSVIQLIEKSILEQQNISNEYSFEFKNKFDKIKRYIKKRMMFGSMFQDSLPFPSLLMDKNLKLIWANKLFCETWSIDKEEINSETVGWDTVAKITNLGEEDPVYEAIKNGIAGVYQIQVRFSENMPSEPFEMYVSPTEYAGEKRVQVYFYSLTSVQDVIASQSKSIVGPVLRTLEALMKGSFDSQFQGDIKSDYEAAQIENLYEKFLKYNDYVVLQREGLLSEIDRLEDTVTDNEKIINDVGVLNSSLMQSHLELIKDLGVVRSRIIELSEVADGHKAMNVELSRLVESNLERYRNSIEKNKNLFDSYDEGLKSIPTIDKFKDELKIVRTELVNSKNKIAQTITKLTPSTDFAVKSELDYKTTALTERIQLELEKLTDIVGILEKKMVFLEVQFSKTQMVFNEHKKTIYENKVENETVTFERYKDYSKNYSSKLRELERRTDISESEVVSRLKSIYDLYRSNAKTIYQIKEIISDKKVAAEPTGERTPEQEV
ncbi:MAG: hypothetical protein JNM93_07095 [Bacteriovoracaceae bacterium]|nr:hypothetical protein [Bacteriovoracaceae bacterium]